MQNNAPVVLKFGGSSVANPERIRRVAAIVAAHRRANSRVLVVVSAMGDTTDDLIELARAVSPRAGANEHRREMDMLLSTGERISMSLLSMALKDLGVEAISLTGSQSGILTDEVHGGARVAEIKPIRIDAALPRGQVVIVAGFQGVSREKEITTLGRGGSDTTAVALAAHFGSRECVIYTDVDGVYSADPRVVVGAKRLDRLGWDSALEASARGAQVLHPRCVELGWKHGVAIRVRSTFAESESLPVVGTGGTLIEGCDRMSHLEGPKFLSLAVKKNLAAFRAPGDLKSAQALREKASAMGIELFAFRWSEGAAVFFVEAAKASALQGEGATRSADAALFAAISVVGCGLLQTPEPARLLADGLEAKGFHLTSLSTSSTILEAVVEETASLDQALPALHEALMGQKVF